MAEGNHLIHESSPYLQQHADNPIDWYPWGEEAFDLARIQDKPVLLSIGYSTCHWCHVMERESFSDPEVGKIVNRVFVAIKVDREEHPEVDAVYMQAARMMHGGGGWPLNILLTPDKKPFYAATYMPKTTRAGRMGLLDLCRRIEVLWQRDRKRIETSADALLQGLQRNVALTMPGDLGAFPYREAYLSLREDFDREHGGFGSAPKFPSPHTLLFLLRYAHLFHDEEALNMVIATLDAMRRGGIRDYLGGGFHRYATDAAWILPHFEKMLYDQAMLLMAYAEAWQVTRRPEFAEIVHSIAGYLLRDMRAPSGAFYAAEDADSEGEEGRFYTWSASEIQSVLGERQAADLMQAYGMNNAGNVWDEATHQSTGRNVFLLRPGVDEGRWKEARRMLKHARDQRIRPFRDEKILTDWNGLAIAGLAFAGRVLEEPAYIEAAASAAEDILQYRQDSDISLVHSRVQDTVSAGAKLDDYTHFIWGLIELYQADFQAKWLEQALHLNAEMLKLFQSKHGALYQTATSQALIARPMDSFDGALPSANAVAMHNAWRLSKLTGDMALAEQADAIARAFAGVMKKAPAGMLHMLSARMSGEKGGREIVLNGVKKSPEAEHMLQVIRHHYLPDSVILWHDKHTEKLAPFIRGQRSDPGKVTAYICEGFACSLPADEPEVVESMLAGSKP